MCQSACCGVIDKWFKQSLLLIALWASGYASWSPLHPCWQKSKQSQLGSLCIYLKRAIAFICLVLTGTLGVGLPVFSKIYPSSGLPEFFLKSILHLSRTLVQGLWRLALDFLDLYISIELSRTPKVVKETVGAFWDKADENQWQSYACIHWTVDSSLSISSNVVFISYFITDLFGGRSSPNSTQKKCQGFWSFPMVPRLTFQSSIKVPSTHCKCLCNISHVYSIHALAVCKYIAHVWSHKLMRSTKKVLYYMYIYIFIVSISVTYTISIHSCDITTPNLDSTSLRCPKAATTFFWPTLMLCPFVSLHLYTLFFLLLRPPFRSFLFGGMAELLLDFTFDRVRDPLQVVNLNWHYKHDGIDLKQVVNINLIQRVPDQHPHTQRWKLICILHPTVYIPLPMIASLFGTNRFTST